VPILNLLQNQPAEAVAALAPSVVRTMLWAVLEMQAESSRGRRTVTLSSERERVMARGGDNLDKVTHADRGLIAAIYACKGTVQDFSDQENA
jgi:hypothetical protein